MRLESATRHRLICNNCSLIHHWRCAWKSDLTTTSAIRCMCVIVLEEVIGHKTHSTSAYMDLLRDLLFHTLNANSQTTSRTWTRNNRFSFILAVPFSVLEVHEPFSLLPSLGAWNAFKPIHQKCQKVYLPDGEAKLIGFYWKTGSFGLPSSKDVASQK